MKDLTPKWQVGMVVVLLLAGCGSAAAPPPDGFAALPAAVYYDKLHGAWQATMVANHTGLVHEGRYIDAPSSAQVIELVLLERWTTDDDTAIEWVDLHILETYGLDPTYAQIRDEWLAHINHDIWGATRQARDLMDAGVLPPETGSAELNPLGVWTISAQLETELFGLIAPGLPSEAGRRASYFARVTNSGLAVDASGFYATMYALAFFEPDVPTLIETTQVHFSPQSRINQIVDWVTAWHRQFPSDWRETRRHIRDAYDTDPGWNASQVNFASTIMALLYGDGDLRRTMTIACLAGWDADNNATTSAGLLGLISGYSGLPEEIRTASGIYENEDVSGGLPQQQSVRQIAARTQALGAAAVRLAGGWVQGDVIFVPVK